MTQRCVGKGGEEMERSGGGGWWGTLASSGIFRIQRQEIRKQTNRVSQQQASHSER